MGHPTSSGRITQMESEILIWFLGVGNTLEHRRYQGHSECPLCKTTNEKVSHVLHCLDHGAATNTLQKIGSCEEDI